MAFTASVLKVLIASPGDTLAERDVIERSLHRWNGDRAEQAGVMLLPRRWETDAVPLLASDGQAVINSQLVDSADVVIGVFFSRLGRPTPRGASGTAEELERAHAAGRKVHVYFSQMPLPADVDLAQVQAMRTFKSNMEDRGLIGVFASKHDLDRQVRSALEHDVARLTGAQPVKSSDTGESGGARLLVEYRAEEQQQMNSAGTPRRHIRNERLTVKNTGSVRAEGVALGLHAIGDGSLPIVHGGDLRPDIPAGGHYSFRISTNVRVVHAVQVTLSWREGSRASSDVQTISLTL